ncbi:MAG: LysM peptidoglycan-binding domain-containing protein [Anaerolineaceae bacterium]|nr:LysM peptidoglycan-binding domain-containing protein [Anaerolineaceae bacterium]
MNKRIDFSHYRWAFIPFIGIMLLATMAFNTAPTILWACGTTTHVVQSGETLSSIASSCGVSLGTLEAANPQITDPSLIFIGEEINLPGSGTVVVTPVPVVEPVTTSTTYTVQAGDSLGSIASRFGVSLITLEEDNPQITNPSLIFSGEVINIPAGGVIPVTGGGGGGGIVEPGSGTYIVQPGDSLGSIANRFGVSLIALEDDNPQITNPSLIFSGQVINIPAGGVIPVTGGGGGGGIIEPTVEPGTRTYIVQSGDFMISIANRFGVSLTALEEANPQITNPRLIFPGQEIVIP